jgi:hypothetical protein
MWGTANQLRGIGLVARVAGSHDELPFLGTCFALRSQSHFVTAAHCVGDLDPTDVSVVVPLALAPTVAIGIEKHPSADLAIVRLPAAKNRVEPFWGAVPPLGLGEDFYAFGYPANAVGADWTAPTPRMFKGHFQRFLDHRSHLGYQYRAAELSISAPRGLSGAPLFRPAAEQMVTGVVVEDLETTSVLDEMEEKLRDGKLASRIVRRRVISYGIAALLDPLKDWLDEQLPTFDPSEWVRREADPRD